MTSATPALLRASLERFHAAAGPRVLLAPFGGRWIMARGAVASLAVTRTGTVWTGSVPTTLPADPLQAVETCCLEQGLWAVGYLSYEALHQPGTELERDLGWPLLSFHFFSEPDVFALPASFDPRIVFTERATRSGSCQLEPDWPAGSFADLVERIRDLIRAGDCYQINLVQRFRTAFPQRLASALFAALRRHDPSTRGYRALLEENSRVLISDSPELFLKREGNLLCAEPIKGTQRRTPGQGPRNLLESAKDRAELAMIVDLLRNDLGASCLPGSIKTGPFPELIELPSLYHTTARISGELRPDAGLSSIMRAGFPSGSISGCPKSRAIQRIEELERRERGPMMGSVGWVNPQADFCFNVAIRTALLQNDELILAAGGGITWDSVPREEELESLDKTAALRAALDGFRGRSSR